MSRPAKASNVSSGKLGQDEKDARKREEDKIRGEAVAPDPPEYLTDSQKDIFLFICDQLKESGILGKLDVYVLEATAVAIDRIHTINAMVDKDPAELSNTSLQNTRAKYQSDLWRGCNELCLSPQARAKIGGMVAQQAKEKRDPLLDALREDD